MENLVLKYDPSVREVEIHLPPSKSIAARALVMAALSPRRPHLPISPDNDDIRVMLNALGAFDSPHVGSKDIYLQASGTAMRLLTSFFAVQEGADVVLSGVPRLLERPMEPLLRALRSLGADVSHTPGSSVHIRGRRLEGGEVTIDPTISSQFITSLLLVAPTFSRGLLLRFSDSSRPVSLPYVEMTVSLMRSFGIGVDTLEENGAVVGWRVAPGEYSIPDGYAAERDWSSASYVYELLAMHRTVCCTPKRIFMPHLTDPQKSLQGDAGLAAVFARLGVRTEVREDGIVASVEDPSVEGCRDARVDVLKDRVIEMREMPDVVPALAVAICGCRLPLSIRGVANLRLKECDRIDALQRGLAECGYCLLDVDDCLELRDDVELSAHPVNEPKACDASPVPKIETFGDHRIAMAFAPMAMLHPGLVIVDSKVVDKSFPAYFQEMRKAGLESTPCP